MQVVDTNGNIFGTGLEVTGPDGKPKTISGGGGPTGPAGGDLSGTYPNPSVVWNNGTSTYGLLYYPLSTNPSGFITAFALTPYLTITLAASTYYPIPTGTVSQYIRGDGTLATFPTIPSITPAALTKTDDTNVTLTLGGTPATALLQSTSLTLGWTGTLADSRITSATTWNNKVTSLSSGTGISIGGTTTVPIVTNTAPDQTVVLTPSTGISVTGTYPSFTIASTITQYTDALARLAISLTTTGTSGAATYNSTTGVLNIPQYLSGGGMIYPAAGIALSTGSAWGTSITNNSADWNTAYTNRITSLTTTGSGAATLVSNVLNIPTPPTATFTSLTVTGSSGSSTLLSGVLNVPAYTLTGLGGQPLATNLTSLAGLSYASASFVKMTGTGVFALDTNTYITGNQTITLSGNVTGTGTTAITTTIGANVVTNAMLAQVATSTIQGRVTAGTGNIETLTGTQATTLIDTFTSTLKGLAPASGGGTANFLRADGTWAAPSGGGGVTAVTATTPVVATGTTTPVISLASNYGDTQNPYGSKTANHILAAPNGTAGVPTFRAIVAADIPTLNQNTTGTAANVTGIVALSNGGTGTASPSLVAGTNITITGTFPNQTIAASGSAGAVTQIVAGTNVTISPVGGTGIVTINSSGGGGGTIIKLTAQTLTSASWILVSGFYTYTFTNVNITVNTRVDFTPNNTAYLEVTTCGMQTQVTVAAGSCIFYSLFPPQTNITGEITIFPT